MHWSAYYRTRRHSHPLNQNCKDDGSVVCSSRQIKGLGARGGRVGLKTMLQHPFTNPAKQFRILSTYYVSYYMRKNLQSTNFQKNCLRTNFFAITNLPTRNLKNLQTNNLKKSSPTNFSNFTKPTSLKSQKPAHYQLFFLNQGGTVPLDSHLSQPWEWFRSAEKCFHCCW